MGKMRVYQLAKELGLENTDLVAKLQSELGIAVKSHMSMLEDDQVAAVRERFSVKPVEAPAPPPVEVIEQRVGSRILRRRVKVVEPAVVAEPVPPVLEGPPAPAVVELPREPAPRVPSVPELPPLVEAPLPPAPPVVPAERPAPPPEPVLTIPRLVPAPEPGPEPAQPTPGAAEAVPGGAAKVGEKRKREEIFERRPARPPWPGPGRGRRPLPRRPAPHRPAGVGTVPRPPAPVTKKVIKISEAITVSDLSQRMGIKAGEVIKKLMELGIMATINQAIDAETAALVAQEFGHQVESVAVEEQSFFEAEEADAPETLLTRPPVVTIMGHVDHGKTTLLDTIRKTDLASREAGGITQHIGAYDVALEKGHVVFLDTPGHEAFTAMRARGAQVTDVVVLVVAADDGVQAQTLEAINHARAANVPIMVAINKIDKPGANPDRVKQVLTEHGLVPEGWGGDTVYAEVSAKQHRGIKEMLELLLLQAELLELKANANKRGRGPVIEAKLDKGRGPVATVLVREGTLRAGDPFICGTQYGRIRALINDKGKKIEEAGPSMPVEVLGLSGVPDAGEPFITVREERIARQIGEMRLQKQREATLAKTARVSLEELYEKVARGDVKELNLIVKADVHGSVEAITEALKKLATDAIKVNAIHGSVGGITESDIMLASASNAIILGFNVRPEPKAQAVAEQEQVDVRLYTVIYDAIEDVKKAMEGLLAPTLKEKVMGRAEVRNTFNISKVGTIAGSYVTEGRITRGSNLRLLRDSVVVHEGRVGSLRRFKEDVREVEKGYECGIGIENYNDLKVGDVIECYTIEKVAAKLE
ncbi:MAG: translation initiation factor IF-2 [Deltaproteobacteria bacterium]|nr:translation initiation factor IF-2 [Deltaproteobacteria bacterium]